MRAQLTRRRHRTGHDVTDQAEATYHETPLHDRHVALGARFIVVANASNAHIVSDALVERLAGFRAVLDDRSLAMALCTVQGPRSVDIVEPVTDVDLGALRYYAIGEGRVAGIPALVARTGYTGEDGFEIFVDNARALELWDARTTAGEPHGLAPV